MALLDSDPGCLSSIDEIMLLMNQPSWFYGPAISTSWLVPYH